MSFIAEKQNMFLWLLLISFPARFYILFFEKLVKYLPSAPVFVMVWQADGVIAMARKMMGATFGFDAEAGTIRGDFSSSKGYNLIHGSDSPESASYEMDLYFKPEEIVDYEFADGIGQIGRVAGIGRVEIATGVSRVEVEPEQLLDRERRAADRRLKAARFPGIKTLDTFDFASQPSINETLVRELMQGQYIAGHENVLIVGNSGTGKTHLATALGFAACSQGRRVRFFGTTGRTAIGQCSLEPLPSPCSGVPAIRNVREFWINQLSL